MALPRLIDFHCHLDLYPDHEQAVTACDREGIYTLAVTTTPRAWPRNRDLTKNTRFVRAALGLHPQTVGKNAKSELELWEKYLPETRYIGEVGLDAGPRFFRSLDEQTRIFEHVLQCCARAGGKILSVHSVRASSKVLDLIENHLTPKRGKVVLHWFMGSESEVRRAVELGCYFSVNAEMSRSKRGQALLKQLPLERVLTETDGPFTIVDGRPAEPRDVVNVIGILSQTRHIDGSTLRDAFLRNLKVLLED
jgi:TatD DNase family protein